MDFCDSVDLQKKNINIPSSVLVKKNQKTTLKELFSNCCWNEAILKPTISGAARHTFRIHREKIQEFDNLFSDLIKSEDFLFQEFLTDITLNGEISLIMIDGKYTHAVRKIAKKGDFRVQDDHGGKVEKYNANKYEIQFARKCWENCPEPPLYARVDIVYDNNGNFITPNTDNYDCSHAQGTIFQTDSYIIKTNNQTKESKNRIQHGNQKRDSKKRTQETKSNNEIKNNKHRTCKA